MSGEEWAWFGEAVEEMAAAGLLVEMHYCRTINPDFSWSFGWRENHDAVTRWTYGRTARLAAERGRQGWLRERESGA